jgi:hypothetical protein
MKPTATLIIRAYIDLLKIQSDGTRVRLDSTYCVLRDEISRLTGRAAQDVQETCEAIALLERNIIS